MRRIPVKIKKVNEMAKLPSKGSTGAAGYDLYACIGHGEICVIPPHETVKIGTGLAMAPPEEYWVGIFARSGIATREGLRPANCVAVIDNDYRGEVLVPIHNDSNYTRVITDGDRIAQMVIMDQIEMDTIVTDELEDTARGAGGFGSSGT